MDFYNLRHIVYTLPQLPSIAEAFIGEDSTVKDGFTYFPSTIFRELEEIQKENRELKKYLTLKVGFVCWKPIVFSITWFLTSGAGKNIFSQPFSVWYALLDPAIPSFSLSRLFQDSRRIAGQLVSSILWIFVRWILCRQKELLLTAQGSWILGTQDSKTSLSR